MNELTKSFLNEGQTTVSNFLLNNYRKIGLTNDDVFIYILIKQANDLVIPMPKIKNLRDQTGYSENKLFSIFHDMIEKKVIKITNVKIGSQQIDAYDFSPMIEKLALLKKSSADVEENQESKTADDSQREKVFENIEQEFGRTLSPMEMEAISKWLDIDHYSPEVVLLALKEAVMSQVYNWKYMDRILISWQKKNLRSAQQIESYSASRSRHGADETDDSSANYNGPDIPIINLED